MYILKTLTMHISFDWYALRLWYFTQVYLLWRRFQWVWTDLTLMFDMHFENFNHAYIICLVCTRTVIFDTSVCCDKIISVGINRFDFVNLTFMFDLLTENFNLGCIFWMVCIWILIFYMSVCYDKIFPLVPTVWLCELDLCV
jgi:hypothetical protein